MQRTLRLCTLNVGLPQVSVFGRRLEPVPYVEERMAALPSFIRSTETDLVFLQELFHAKHRDTLCLKLQDQYPYAAFHESGGPLRLSNGLLCLSRFPLRDAVFTSFADCCIEERLCVSKGFLSMGVELDGALVHVVNTHLTAGGFFSHPEHVRYDGIRTRQIEQLLRQVDPSSCGLVVGDFNAGPQVSSTNYLQLTNNLSDAYDLAASRRGSAFTWDPKNRLNVGGPHKMCPAQRIDLVLCTPGFIQRYGVTSYWTSGDKSPVPVSDHWAVVTECAMRLPCPVGFARIVTRLSLTGFCFINPLHFSLYQLAFLSPFTEADMQYLASDRGYGFLGTTTSQGDFAPPFFPEGPEALEAYQKRLHRAVSEEGFGVHIQALVQARLCHGTTIKVFSPEMGNAVFGQTDGLVCAEPYTALVVTGADCPPVFLYDSRRRVIGLAHSGREGTRQNIVANLLHMMEERYDCTPDDILAVIGPGICQDHYQVKPEMAGSFRELGFDTWKIHGGHGYLDLPGTIASQLMQQGVHRDRITRPNTNPCTFENPDWHSYRRDKVQGVLSPEARPRTSAFVAMMF